MEVFKYIQDAGVHFDVTSLCENIILHFQQSIHQFYDAIHLKHPPIVKDRNGHEILLEPLTLSIAVVTNE